MQDLVKFTGSGGILTAHIMCEIDHHTAKKVRERIDKELFEYRPDILVLDFQRVGFMDSSGIGLILGRADICEVMRCHLRINSLSPQLKKLVKLSGIEKIQNLSIG